MTRATPAVVPMRAPNKRARSADATGCYAEQFWFRVWATSGDLFLRRVLWMVEWAPYDHAGPATKTATVCGRWDWHREYA